MNRQLGWVIKKTEFANVIHIYSCDRKPDEMIEEDIWTDDPDDVLDALWNAERAEGSSRKKSEMCEEYWDDEKLEYDFTGTIDPFSPYSR